MVNSGCNCFFAVRCPNSYAFTEILLKGVLYSKEPPLGVIREQGEWALRPKGARSYLDCIAVWNRVGQGIKDGYSCNHTEWVTVPHILKAEKGMASIDILDSSSRQVLHCLTHNHVTQTKHSNEFMQNWELHIHGRNLGFRYKNLVWIGSTFGDLM